eukprot:613588-Alexandrium_andersonii.AAC.1
MTLLSLKCEDEGPLARLERACTNKHIDHVGLVLLLALGPKLCRDVEHCVRGRRRPWSAQSRPRCGVGAASVHQGEHGLVGSYLVPSDHFCAQLLRCEVREIEGPDVGLNLLLTALFLCLSCLDGLHPAGPGATAVAPLEIALGDASARDVVLGGARIGVGAPLGFREESKAAAAEQCGIFPKSLSQAARGVPRTPPARARSPAAQCPPTPRRRGRRRRLPLPAW